MMKRKFCSLFVQCESEKVHNIMCFESLILVKGCVSFT